MSSKLNLQDQSRSKFVPSLTPINYFALFPIDFSAGNIIERLVVILGDHDLTTNEDTTKRILRHTKKVF